MPLYINKNIEHNLPLPHSNQQAPPPPQLQLSIKLDSWCVADLHMCTRVSCQNSRRPLPPLLLLLLFLLLLLLLLLSYTFTNTDLIKTADSVQNKFHLGSLVVFNFPSFLFSPSVIPSPADLHKQGRVPSSPSCSCSCSCSCRYL